VQWSTCSAFQDGSGLAPIIARAASSPARILLSRSDAAAGLDAFAVVLAAYVRIILGALDTFFLGKPFLGKSNID
jgi:hypothetical protein